VLARLNPGLFDCCLVIELPAVGSKKAKQMGVLKWPERLNRLSQQRPYDLSWLDLKRPIDAVIRNHYSKSVLAGIIKCIFLGCAHGLVPPTQYLQLKQSINLKRRPFCETVILAKNAKPAAVPMEQCSFYETDELMSSEAACRH
jgi:hypothetical protein